MHFKVLAIEASRQAEIPAGLTFRWTVHHVKEIFVSSLPPQLDVDGSEKIQITCGPRGEEPQHRQVLGTTNVFVETFDFHAYMAAQPSERDEQILRLIEDTLVELARAAGRDGTAIATAAATVRQLGFRQATEVKRLSSTLPTGGRVVAVRSLSREHGECWRIRVERKHARSEERILGRCPHYMDMRDAFRESAIEGMNFVVRNRFGKTMATVSLEGLV